MFISIILDVEVACTNYEGIDAVKRALKKGLELSTETMPIKVAAIPLPLPDPTPSANNLKRYNIFVTEPVYFEDLSEIVSFRLVFCPDR